MRSWNPHHSPQNVHTSPREVPADCSSVLQYELSHVKTASPADCVLQYEPLQVKTDLKIFVTLTSKEGLVGNNLAKPPRSMFSWQKIFYSRHHTKRRLGAVGRLPFFWCDNDKYLMTCFGVTQLNRSTCRLYQYTAIYNTQ